jgi:uncharacterized membrane protein
MWVLAYLMIYCYRMTRFGRHLLLIFEALLQVCSPVQSASLVCFQTVMMGLLTASAVVDRPEERSLLESEEQQNKPMTKKGDEAVNFS